MFTSADLQNMRIAQNEHMQDICNILARTAGTLNEYNEQDAPTYATRSISACGLDMKSGAERNNASNTVVNYDAVLRLPLSTKIDETDRIEVTARYAEYPDTLTFEIVSPIQRGPSGIRVLLRKIVT